MAPVFRLSITVDVPDMDKRPIEIPCPRCELHAWVRLGDIRRRDFVICRGCHATLRLEDHLGEVHRFVRKFTRTLKSLERSFG